MKYLFNEQEHLHTLDGKSLTGASSIGKVLFKPLTYWASGLACAKFGWINPKYNSAEDCAVAMDEGFEKVKKLERDEYAKLVSDAYVAHATSLKESAGKGKELHDILERFCKAEMKRQNGKTFQYPNEDEMKKIKPFVDWSIDNVNKFISSEAHSFDEETWTGGISDAVVELKDGKLAVGDFKSSKEAYMTQFLQATLYVIQIDKNGLWDSKGEKNKKLDKEIEAIIVVPFGAYKIVPEVRTNLAEYKEGARAAVLLYRLLGIEKLQ